MAATATPGVLRSRTRVLVASADPAFRKRIMADPAYADTLNEEAIGGAHALAKLVQFPCDGVLLDRNLQIWMRRRSRRRSENSIHGLRWN